MGIFYSVQSPKNIVEQAKYFRTDVEPLNAIRAEIASAGNVVTLKPAKGKTGTEKHVFAGDLSAEDTSGLSNVRPLFSLEYRTRNHCALVKSADTGDVLMMLVKEYNDNPWYDDNQKAWKCTFGGATEARLYANGRPVGVSFRQDYLNAAPASQVNGEERPQVGASMVELLKVRQSPSLIFAQRKKDGSAGKEVAIYSRTRGASILRISDTAAADPIVLATMAWFVNLDEKGGVGA